MFNIGDIVTMLLSPQEFVGKPNKYGASWDRLGQYGLTDSGLHSDKIQSFLLSDLTCIH